MYPKWFFKDFRYVWGDQRCLFFIFCKTFCLIYLCGCWFQSIWSWYALILELWIKFRQKNLDIFLIFAQNIDCGYTLEPPHRGGSNEYPQSMFWSKNKKNRYCIPPHTPVLLYKDGVQGGIHYTDMFSWCLDLRRRGILLSVQRKQRRWSASWSAPLLSPMQTVLHGDPNRASKSDIRYLPHLKAPFLHFFLSDCFLPKCQSTKVLNFSSKID